jgi:hypothetical protein
VAVDVILNVRRLEANGAMPQADRGQLAASSEIENDARVLAEDLANAVGGQELREPRLHAVPPSERAPPGAALPEVRRSRQPVACYRITGMSFSGYDSTMPTDVGIAYTDTDTVVECRCARCRIRSFGSYVLDADDNGSIFPWDRARLAPVAVAIWGKRIVLPWQPQDGSTRQLKGPRTGTGLYGETFEGRRYVRAVCKCGRNEKIGMAKLDALMFDADGALRLRDGVLMI